MRARRTELCQGDLSSSISLRSTMATAVSSSSLRDFHSVYLVERLPAQSSARYHSDGGNPNLYGSAVAFVLNYCPIFRRCTAVNLPIGSACTVKSLYRYCVSHTAPPPVLPCTVYRLMTVLSVSGTPVPAALCGGPHAGDHLFSYRRVSPSFLGRRRFLLTRNRIGV
jgi:hypothetical protein